jgi:hypothetical protein
MLRMCKALSEAGGGGEDTGALAALFYLEVWHVRKGEGRTQAKQPFWEAIWLLLYTLCHGRHNTIYLPAPLILGEKYADLKPLVFRIIID